MPEVVDILQTEDPRDAIHLAVQHLSRGGVVAFPSASSSPLCALSLSNEGVQNLRQLVPEQGATLLLKGLSEALDYVPTLSETGRRLARRCWPGAVTMAVPTVGSEEKGLLPSLAETLREWLCPLGEIRLAVPDDEVLQSVLALSSCPLVAIEDSLRRFHSPSMLLEFFDGEEHADSPLLIIVAGEVSAPISSSVVRVGAEQEWSMLETGGLDEKTVQKLLAQVIVFICTGNTCRSPMAEMLLKHMLSQRLDVPVDDLVDRGFHVISAGLAAYPGSPASSHAVALLKEQGIDLSGHSSQPLVTHIVEQADVMVTMTRAHRDAILSQRPDLAERVRVLASDGGDVADPYGGSMEEYDQCRQQIAGYLEHLLDTLPLPK